MTHVDHRHASSSTLEGDALTDLVALGYASLPEPAIAEGVRRLAGALAATAG